MIKDKKTTKSDQKRYYEGRLKMLGESVKACDIITLTDVLDFFISEANTHMSGIDEEVHTDIRYYIRKFKDRCTCKNI